MEFESLTPVGPRPHVAYPAIYPIERQTIGEIKRELSGIDRLHGAISRRVLIYAPSGCGKRRIARQAAEEIVADDGRKLFVVEARTIETFVRDYYNIYFSLTGEKLYSGLELTSLLLKIKRTLQQRQHEWLLLLNEVSPWMENTYNAFGQKMNEYVPDRGQVIMTYSTVIRLPGETDSTHAVEFICRSEPATDTRLICLPDSSVAESFVIMTYGAGACAGLLTEPIRKLHGLASPTLIFMLVVAANLRMLNISSETYIKIHRRRAGKYPPQHEVVAWAKSSFHIAMHILWETLADRDIWTTRILAALAITNTKSLETPLELLQTLPVLNRTTSDRFTPALDMLTSLGLVSITKNFGDEMVTTHLQVMDWVRLHIRRVYSEKDYSDLVYSWVDLLSSYLEAEHPSGKSQVERWWNLCSIMFSVLDAAACRELSSCALLEFIIALSELIADDGRLSRYAIVLLRAAEKMWDRTLGMLSTQRLDDDIYFIRIKQALGLAHLSVSEDSLAEAELSRARHSLNCLKQEATSSTTVISGLEDKLDELQVRVYLEYGNFEYAVDLLGEMLDREEEATESPAKVAQWQHWLALALSNIPGQGMVALEYSHCAIKHWAELPEEMKNSKTDILRMAKWALEHACLLISHSKHRGALLFLPRLFDIWSEIYPCDAVTLWRIVDQTLWCYVKLRMVTEAEDLVVRVLEKFPIDELDDKSHFFALHILYQLGTSYAQYGRLVEAEGIFRFLLRSSQKRAYWALFESAYGKGAVPSDWWARLVVVLASQGRHQEARRVRNQYQDDRFNEADTDQYLTDGEERYRIWLDLHQRAMWAEQDGMLREWCLLLRRTDDLDQNLLYIGATKQFGDISSRVRAGMPVEYDTDLHLSRLARKSKVLYLLGYSLIGTSFRFRSADSEGSEYDDCLPSRQHLISEYFSLCHCRRHRSRSGSIKPGHLIDKRLVREAAVAVATSESDEDENERGDRKLKQSYIDDYFFIMVESPFKLLSCHEECPCREATLCGLAEYAELEKRLWNMEEWLRSRPSILPGFFPAPRSQIKSSALLPDQVFTSDLRNPVHWRWVQGELSLYEDVQENFILPDSLTIPTLAIYPPEGQVELTTDALRDIDIQPPITKFLHTTGNTMAKVEEQEQEGECSGVMMEKNEDEDQEAMEYETGELPRLSHTEGEEGDNNDNKDDEEQEDGPDQLIVTLPSSHVFDWVNRDYVPTMTWR